MTLQNLRFLIAIVECGGVGKAAEYLNLSQPAITGGLKALEGELGQPLFERKPGERGVRATAKALAFYEDALDILRKCESARDRFGSNRTSAPALRIGLMRTIAIRQVESFTCAMATRYPQLRLHFREAGRSRLEDWFQRRTIDIAWTLIDDCDRRVRRLWSERYVALMSRAHPLARDSHAVLSWSDIEGEIFVLRTSCEIPHANVWPKGFKMRVSARAERDELALKLVAAGIGIAIAPMSLATTEVVARSIRELRTKRTIGIKWHRDLPAASVGAVLGALRTQATSP
jgi:DNA-binding transcriptional LysR family regulator